ncbi:MAG: hypothetical protein LC118_02510 [Dehalococcoidia bacterium]|nr:hypothetical protein [Dehalococcoidia bacterium]
MTAKPHGDPKLPPVMELGVASLICTLAAGVIVSARVPKTDIPWPAIVLLVLSAALLVAAGVLMARLREFAWRSFFQIWKWAMLAYIVIAGMIEFVFIHDETPGSILTMLTLLLIAFAITVPSLLAFSVARFQDV